jgi:hypothetical protein
MAEAIPRAPTGSFGRMGTVMPGLKPYMPSELIGGSIPYIAGKEDEGVWNAAAQACGTERVHYCYTIDEGRCWYLATPSSSLASDPDSWCPLAAALPGNSEYWDRQTVYIYENEGQAGALRWDQETGRLQIYLGVARTILPRIQSMEANFVTINVETAKPVAWKNRALNQEMLSRALVKGLFYVGAVALGFSLLVWVGAYTVVTSLKPRLDEAHKIASKATNDLMVDAANALQTNTDGHLARIMELLDTTGSFGGVLTRYEVKPDNTVEWTALIPNAVQPSQLQATAMGMASDGRIQVKGTK